MSKFESGVWGSAEWNHMWESNSAEWQMPEPDANLGKHVEKTLPGKSCRVFVPLCGKSLDMIWFYQKGHSVVGVEISEKAVREFFEENKISFDVEEVNNVGKCYTSKDKRMTLYAADLFSLSKENVGPIDLIWDAGSLTAINTGDNKRYVDLLSSFLKEDSLWFVFTFYYDLTVWPGPPHSHSDEQFKALFGGRFRVEMVDEEDTKKGHHESADKPTEGKTEEGIVEKITTALSKSAYMFSRLYKCVPT